MNALIKSAINQLNFLQPFPPPCVYANRKNQKLPSKEVADTTRWEVDKKAWGLSHIVWTVLGAKQVLGGGWNRDDWPGELQISGAFRLRHGKPEGKLRPKFIPR